MPRKIYGRHKECSFQDQSSSRPQTNVRETVCQTSEREAAGETFYICEVKAEEGGLRCRPAPLDWRREAGWALARRFTVTATDGTGTGSGKGKVTDRRVAERSVAETARPPACPLATKTRHDTTRHDTTHESFEKRSIFPRALVIKIKSIKQPPSAPATV